MSLKNGCLRTKFKESTDPVFFASHCGVSEQERAKWRPPRPEPESDRRCTSVAAAVEFAHANNLLGVFLNAKLLVRLSIRPVLRVSDVSQSQVPALIPVVKDMNLLLGAFGSSSDVDRLQATPGHPIGRPDGTWTRGIVRFVDNTSLAVQ